jgi:hypothetical protein
MDGHGRDVAKEEMALAMSQRKCVQQPGKRQYLVAPMYSIFAVQVSNIVLTSRELLFPISTVQSQKPTLYATDAGIDCN